MLILPLLTVATAALLAMPSAAFLGCEDKPFMDPKIVDTALLKFYQNTQGPSWPSPWKDRWGTATSCAWDGNERGHPAPFGTRCLDGGWHKLPPVNDGGLLYLESFGRMAKGPVPSEFEVFQMTDFIGLWNNQLTGPIWNTTMHQFLHRLDLSHNQMDGTLPADFMKRNTIHAELINFGSNKFTGPIPASIGTLKILQSLLLDNNQFSGPIPVEITKLKELRHLDLSHNQFSGNVPSLVEMSTLARLDLSYNNFDGPLPELPPSVTHATFSGNKFSGAIGASYGKASYLRHFNCTGCDQVTCPTPDFLAHLPFSTHCKPPHSRKW
jgi:hypothetical protein